MAWKQVSSGRQGHGAHSKGGATARLHPGDRLASLQRAAADSAVIRPLQALQRLADGGGDAFELSPVAPPTTAPTQTAAKGPVIQRVGEARKDIVPAAVPAAQELAGAYAKGQIYLSQAVKKATDIRKLAKNMHWRDIEARADRHGINQAYAEGLANCTLQQLLPQHHYFQQDARTKGWALRANWDPDDVALPDTLRISEEIQAGPPRPADGPAGAAIDTIDLATLEPRRYQQKPAQPAEALRAVFAGGPDAKEYVDDELGVKTRRYAYVEKNYFQMMEFFATNHMEGRFQSLMRASSGEQRPGVRTHGAVPRGAVPGFLEQFQKTRKGASLSYTQLAYVHQYLGSGNHQRGLSLTSTPRKGQTIGNAGENFRSNDGFRMKIDLARIAKDYEAPILINHYAAGGIMGSLGDDGDVNAQTAASGRQPARDYKYTESVTKNRELYLEFLKPEYVVAIEYHPDAAVDALTSQNFSLAQPGGGEDLAAMIANAKAAAHFTAYQRGFDRALTDDPARTADTALAADGAFRTTNPDEASITAWKKGWSAGAEYRVAYQDARAGNAAGAMGAADEFADRRRRGQPNVKDEHTIIKIARIHALHDRQMISGISDLGTTAPAKIVRQPPPVVPVPSVGTIRATTPPANLPNANPSLAPVLSNAAMATRQQPTANPPTVPAPNPQVTAPRNTTTTGGATGSRPNTGGKPRHRRKKG